MKTDVCIIGAGPAGLMAAIYSAKSNAQTTVVEANTAAGRKLLLTGGGRCNITHADGINKFIKAFGTKGRFLQYCFHELMPEHVRKFFAERGLETKVEDDGCVFPVTDSAQDVQKVLLSESAKSGVHFLYDRRVEGIEKCGEGFNIRTGRETIAANKVIIAAGGISYPDTGSTGDGYKFAQKLGHTIIMPKASLVPLITKQTWPAELAGTAVDNVRITANPEKKKFNATGAMLFTQNGIGGPAVVDLSFFLTDYLPSIENPIEISMDMVCGIDEIELEKRILMKFEQNPHKTLINIIAEFLPKRLAAVFCREFGFDGNIVGRQIKKDSRKKLVRTLKGLPLSVTAARPIAEAMVTRGGVNITEINKKTMGSKICHGLFFAGEVMDVDGPCGGYNLQLCWSTGAIAGIAVGRGRC